MAKNYTATASGMLDDLKARLGFGGHDDYEEEYEDDYDDYEDEIPEGTPISLEDAAKLYSGEDAEG